MSPTAILSLQVWEKNMKYFFFFHLYFSEKAVICCRDGALCLMFRLGDERKSHVIDCKIRAWFLQHAVSTEGEILLHHQKKLKVSVDEGG